MRRGPQRGTMRFVYFESLKPDGAVEPQMISSDDFDKVRPLSEGERKFAEKLGAGLFGDDPFRKMSAYESMNWRETDAGREFHHAALDRQVVDHPSAQSVLVTNGGARYFLRETVDELASSQGGQLVVLNGNPEAVVDAEATVVLGRPLLAGGQRLLIEHKRVS